MMRVCLVHLKIADGNDYNGVHVHWLVDNMDEKSTASYPV